MSAKQRKIFTIGIALQLSYASGRDLLYGISRYARTNCHWNLKLISPDDDNGPAADELDGFITSESMPDDFLRTASNLPLVVIGTRESWLKRRMKNLTFVRNDDRDIGRFGAEFLMRLGSFRAFGFVPTNVPYYCSILRHEGFAARLDTGSATVLQYGPTPQKDGSREDLAALKRWLQHLPKPAAVMAVHDLRATHVLEAAREAGLDVPGELAVIGVDNDELLCDFTEPQLTSISPDHVYEGELAAQELHRLLTGRRLRKFSKTVRSKKKTIVERESTKPMSPSARLADTAMTYIRRNALKGIGASDVVKHLGVSRRLADLRFRECHGRSILDIRLNEVKRKLTPSTAPIKSITDACGFSNEIHAKHLFKRRFGVSMSAYRTSPDSASGNRPGKRYK